MTRTVNLILRSILVDPANTSFTFGNELITLDSNGSGSVNLQLSHEDAAAEITAGIPSTVTYTVTENLNSSEGYDTDFAVSKGTGTSGSGKR